MCKECRQYPCLTSCPNGTPMVDVIYVDCALCGAEVDEEATTYGICEKCWTDAHTFDNAMKYGEKAKVNVEVNGLYAKMLTPTDIDSALRNLVNTLRMRYFGASDKDADEFLHDDDGDFADWLKKQKGNE